MIKLFNADSLALLKKASSGSVDALVTDPPAGIGFMGKAWDSDKGGRDQWIAWMTEVMVECYRVMKPGARGLVWALPRTSHWTATALENAGFEVRDIVSHIFGTGFPKSMNVSIAIDKAAGATREVIGKKVFADGSSARKTQNLGGTSFQDPISRENNLVVTAPATDAAKQWSGWGTALKPACEHWILIRKPIEGTVANNVLTHGTGALNIDACRVAGKVPKPFGKIHAKRDVAPGGILIDNLIDPPEPSPLGRFPANLILDEESAAALDAQSGLKCGAAAPVRKKDTPLTTNVANIKPHTSVGDDGASFRGDTDGASRFFYVAKASKADKNAGLSDSQATTVDDGRNTPIDNPFLRGKTERLNTHPTVKSTELMKYLCTLITPPGGVILDPFMGSGSTGVAAVNLNFKFIGIEKETEYFNIARLRIKANKGSAGE